MTQLNIVNEFPTVGVPIWVKRLEDDESVDVVLISRNWLRLCVHWDPNVKPKGKTLACTKPISECVGHRRGLAVRGKAYAHVWNVVEREQQFLELPPKAWKSFCNQLGKPDSYRGIRCHVQRGRGKKARVTVRVDTNGWEQRNSPLPAELSPLISLCPLWGIKLAEITCEAESDFENLAS